MAPNRDDSDHEQAMERAESSGSSDDPAPEGPGSRREGSIELGTGGGDPGTEGGAGTIDGGDADAVSATIPVAERGDADTEGIIAEGSDPAAERLEAQEPPPVGEAGWDATASAVTTDAAAPITEPDTVDPVAGELPPATAPVEEPVSVPADTPDDTPDDTELPVVETDTAPPAVDFDEPDDASTPPPPVAPPTKSRRTAVVVLSVLTLVVAGVGVGAFLWTRGSDDTATPPPPTQVSNPGSTLSEGAFVTFKDTETGFTMRYPRGWKRSEAPVREIRLIASDGKQYSVLVRVSRTQEVTTPANLANVKSVTDGIVGPGVQILKQEPVTVNGLIGYRYIYTFTDKDNGLTSAHVHYFLFQGHKMNSIVFEALPTESFDRIQGTYDQMIESFHSDPEPP